MKKKEFDKSVETKIDRSSKEFTKNYGIGKNFKKIIIVVIIIALIGIAAVYFSTNGLTFLGDKGQIVKDNKGIHYEEKQPVNKLDMVTTKIKLDDKHCKVWAKLYTEPDNFDQYKVHTKYFDSSDQLISESDTSMKDIKEDGDRLLIVDYNSDKVVHSVEITISDENGNQVFHVHNKPN